MQIFYSCKKGCTIIFRFAISKNWLIWNLVAITPSILWAVNYSRAGVAVLSWLADDWTKGKLGTRGTRLQSPMVWKKSLTNRSRKIDLPFLLEDTFYTGIFCQKIRLTDVSEYGHCYCFHFDHRDRHCFHSGLGLWPRWWAGGPRARFDRNRSWLEVKMRLKSCCDGRRGRRTFVAPLSRVHQGLKNFRNAKMWSRKIQWFCSGHLIIFWSTCHFLTASWQRLAVSVWDFSLHAIDKIF